MAVAREVARNLRAQSQRLEDDLGRAPWRRRRENLGEGAGRRQVEATTFSKFAELKRSFNTRCLAEISRKDGASVNYMHDFGKPGKGEKVGGKHGRGYKDEEEGGKISKGGKFSKGNSHIHDSTNADLSSKACESLLHHAGRPIAGTDLGPRILLAGLHFVASETRDKGIEIESDPGDERQGHIQLQSCYHNYVA